MKEVVFLAVIFELFVFKKCALIFDLFIKMICVI